MGLISLLAISIALAMDAFAVAVVAGVTIQKVTGRHLFRLSFHFGLFQALLFATGWLFGSAIHKTIAAFDHWVAFLLLLFVGLNIVRGSFQGEQAAQSKADPSSGWLLVTLSLATSIDALAVGFSLAMVNISLPIAAFTIGAAASVFTLCGMFIGRRIGGATGRWIEVLGGVALIAIGSRVFWQHLAG